MTPAPDDLELHAWLDGELPPERSAQVDSWLREHPEEAARVRLWAADGDALRSRFDGVLDESVPLALAQNVWRKAPASAPGSAWRAGWTRWAAAFALFALGGLAGAALMWRAQGATHGVAVAAEPGWVRRAAVAHAVYVPEVRHPVEVKAQEEHLSRWLTKRIDAPVKLFDLRSQGFELIGGRLPPDASGPSAQLMYQSLTDTAGPDGKPVRVTVYLRRPDDDTPAAFRYEREGDLGMFYWVEGRSVHGGACGYALVGALPRERLLALAEAIFRQGEPAPR